MKKIFTMALAAIAALSMSAQTYKIEMHVWVDGAVEYAKDLSKVDSITFVKKIVDPETPETPTNPNFTPKAFTVNEDGKQVYFSQGNLQYHAASNTWRFAINQYDYVGDANYGNVYFNETKCDNNLIANDYDGWIDLFGWGTGDFPTQSSIKWDVECSCFPDYLTFTDWGINPISNGGNVADIWRTLRIEEWIYLLKNSQHGQATVNGVHGYVLFPEDFTMPSGLTWTYSADTWTANVYDTEAWYKMEEMGAVFLPAAGQRGEVRVGGMMEKAYYWSSSSYEVYGADHVCFNNCEGDSPCPREMGNSVRLVQDVK